MLNLRDTTAQQAMESSLLDHERQFAAIVDHAGDAIVLADDRGRYIAANPAAAELFGRPVETLLQLTVADVTPADHGHAAPWDTLLARGSR